VEAARVGGGKALASGSTGCRGGPFVKAATAHPLRTRWFGTSSMAGLRTLRPARPKGSDSSPPLPGGIRASAVGGSFLLPLRGSPGFPPGSLLSVGVGPTRHEWKHYKHRTLSASTQYQVEFALSFHNILVPIMTSCISQLGAVFRLFPLRMGKTILFDKAPSKLPIGGPALPSNRASRCKIENNKL